MAGSKEDQWSAISVTPTKFVLRRSPVSNHGAEMGGETEGPRRLNGVPVYNKEMLEAATTLMLLRNGFFGGKKDFDTPDMVEAAESLVTLQNGDQSENRVKKPLPNNGSVTRVLGENKVYTCKECGEVFKTPQALGGHMTKHRKEKSNATEVVKDDKKRKMENVGSTPNGGSESDAPVDLDLKLGSLY